MFHANSACRMGLLLAAFSAMVFGNHAFAQTTLLNESWNSATAQTWTDNPAAGAATLSADNSFTVYNGNVSGLSAITDLGGGNLVFEHTSNNGRGTGGAANASDFILMKQSGVPAVDIGTIGANNTLLFQYDVRQNATGVATGVAQQGNRQVGLECYKSTATRDGYAVRLAPRNDNIILQVGKISAAASAPPAVPGGNFTALTGAGAPAMTGASKMLRVIVMLKPTVNGATTGNTNVYYRIVNLTDGTDFVAPAASTIAFGPTAGTVVDHAGLVARQKTLCQIDNCAIIANPNPVLTALGGPITVALGSAYVDNAANIGGLDATDGILTTTSSPTAITNDAASSVNTSVVGTYTVTYTATNSLGKSGTTTRTVNVTDQTAPVITLLGSNPVTVAQGGTYTDAGATASDNVDGNITLNIVTVNPVNTSVVGAYTVTYNVSDAAGNPATQVTRTVNVTDQTAPVITLLGSNPVTVAQGGTYADAGATASDNVDGNITLNIVTVNPVNTSVVGTYTVTYNVSDAAGNPATQVARTVNVTDQAAPNAVTITPGTTGPTNAATVSFTVDFDEAVQDFNNASDVVIAHTGTANTGVSISGGPQNYTVDITGISGNGTFTLAISTSSDVADLAANALASSVTSAAVSIDTLAPTPSLNSTAPATVGGAFTVEVSTGEPTTDFDGSDLTVSNGAISDFAGSGDTYSFTLTPSTSPVSVQINAARYVDAAGNSNLTSSVLSRTFDATLPTVVSIVPVSPISGPTNVDSIVFTVTFDEAVQNVNDGTDFVVGTTGSVNTGTATVSTVSATEYTVTVPGITGDGTLTLQANTASDIRDLSNNPLSASIVSAVITLDNTNPSVLLTSLAPNPTNGPFSVSVSLGESVTTFGSASVSLTNATLSNFAGSGDAYSFTLTAVADGPVSAVVSDLEFSDAAGNPNDASNVFNIVVDTTDPAFTDITAVPSTASAGDEVTITFSTTDTIAGDPEVTVNGNLATRAAKAAFTYTYTVGANDPIGPATIQIDGFDTAGNVGSSSDNTALVIESLEPEVPAANGFTLGIAAVLVALAGAGLLNARTRRDS